VTRRRATSTWLALALLLMPFSPAAADDPEPQSSARLEPSEPTAWTGERITFFVQLRANGSFDGAAAFDLPRIPRTVIVKVGNPVLGSETEGEVEFFSQRHEFALFSQADGPLELPPITARFRHRVGYTGPVHEAELATRPARLTLRRPPGSEELGFLVTTDSLEIEETWDPAPGPLETGAVLERTIVQRAANLTGIALAPAPATAPEGIRLYIDDPEVTDRSGRGELEGTRRDTLTYLVQEAGLHTIPAIRYDWWNPDTETLESKTLPAVRFTATAPPPPPPKPSPTRFLWLLVPAAVIAIAVLCRRPIVTGLHHLHQILDPPPRRIRRVFLKACRRDDARSASRHWAEWRAWHPDFQPDPELARELQALQRRLYGAEAAGASWSGEALATCFKRIHPHRRSPRKRAPLPPLNTVAEPRSPRPRCHNSDPGISVR